MCKENRFADALQSLFVEGTPLYALVAPPVVRVERNYCVIRLTMFAFGTFPQKITVGYVGPMNQSMSDKHASAITIVTTVLDYCQPAA